MIKIQCIECVDGESTLLIIDNREVPVNVDFEQAGIYIVCPKHYVMHYVKE